MLTVVLNGNIFLNWSLSALLDWAQNAQSLGKLGPKLLYGIDYRNGLNPCCCQAKYTGNILQSRLGNRLFKKEK